MSRRPQPCAPKSGFITSGPRAHSRRAMARAWASDLRGEGFRRRDAGPREEKARHALVGAAFDGAGAVEERHAQRLQRMQHAEPHGDRLERAVADGAHDGEIGKRVEAGNGEAVRARRVDPAGGEPHRDRRRASARKAASVWSTCQSSLSVKTATRGSSPAHWRRGSERLPRHGRPCAGHPRQAERRRSGCICAPSARGSAALRAAVTLHVYGRGEPGHDAVIRSLYGRGPINPRRICPAALR